MQPACQYATALVSKPSGNLSLLSVNLDEDGIVLFMNADVSCAFIMFFS